MKFICILFAVRAQPSSMANYCGLKIDVIVPSVQ